MVTAMVSPALCGRNRCSLLQAEAHLSRDPILGLTLRWGAAHRSLSAVHILRRSPERCESAGLQLQPDDLVARSSLGLTVHTQGRFSAEPRPCEMLA